MHGILDVYLILYSLYTKSFWTKKMFKICKNVFSTVSKQPIKMIRDF